jgi:SAM-dependent methyltransferase
MSQLKLWEEQVPSVSSSTPAVARADPTRGRHLSQRSTILALKCRTAAEKLQKHIDAKHASANNMLTQRPTRKRICDADQIRRQAIRLERIQATLRRLADMHEDGSITSELADLTSRDSIESALFTSSVTSAIRVLFDSITRDENKAERVLRLSREASLKKIPGFFPTPPALAERVITLARLSAGLRILEPSAGIGNLIDRARHEGCHIDFSYCEVNVLLLDILREKYDGLPGVRFIGRDFLELDAPEPDNRFDRVIMNPPFERGEDADHVHHAYSFLKQDGILVAIVSAGIFCRTDRKANAFRLFLEEHSAIVEDVPVGAFNSSGTDIATKLVCIEGH